MNDDKYFSSCRPFSSFFNKYMQVGHRSNDSPIITWSWAKAERRRRVGWLLTRLGIGACVTNPAGHDEAAPFGTSPAAWFRRVKVRSHQRAVKEMSFVYSGPPIQAHEGAILTMRFSPDGQFLATGGEDRVVRIWRVSHHRSPSYLDDSCRCAYVRLDDKDSQHAAITTDIGNKRSAKTRVVFPPKVFSLSPAPVHEFHGHLGDVLDLSWSKDKQLLISSSTDKTVRLWRIGHESCIKVFHHSNYVSCVQFNPINQNNFISGCIDGKIRIWDVVKCRVVDWADLRDIVSTVCYRPDGQGAVVGTITGKCRFYDASEKSMAVMMLKAELSLNGKRKSALKRITGIQFCPGNQNRVLVTNSADSKIRELEGAQVVRTFRVGRRSSSAQTSASFTSDGQRVVSASQAGSAVYVWNCEDQPVSGNLKQPKATIISSFESFHSSNASVVAPWNASTSPAMPIASELQTSVSIPTSPAGRRSSATWPEEMLPPSDKIRRHAWGQVIVTAGRDGQIRWFQNLGLPERAK